MEDLTPSWMTIAQPMHDPDELISAAAAVTNLAAEALRSRRRERVHSLARRAVVRCADRLGVSGVTVARALGISQQRVSAILMAPESDDLNALVAGVMDRVRGSARAEVVK